MPTCGLALTDGGVVFVAVASAVAGISRTTAITLADAQRALSGVMSGPVLRRIGATTTSDLARRCSPAYASGSPAIADVDDCVGDLLLAGRRWVAAFHVSEYSQGLACTFRGRSSLANSTKATSGNFLQRCVSCC